PAGGGGAWLWPGSGHGGDFCGRIDSLEGQGTSALKAAPVSSIREAQPYGPVSAAIECSGAVDAAWPRPAAARAADVRFCAMCGAARLQAGLSDAVGADLGRGRLHP